MGIKAVAFDLFNTVLDISDVSRESKKDYFDKIHDPAVDYIWQLNPDFMNAKLFHEDTASLINKIRETCTVITFSNCPIYMQKDLFKLKFPEITFDYKVPLTRLRTKKPRPESYEKLSRWFSYHVNPEEILVVTANKDFGDLEGAAAAGMKSLLIEPGDIQAVLDYLKIK